MVRAYKSKEAHFTITLKDSKGQAVTNVPHAYIVVHLTCLANNYLIECQLTHKQNGVITVSYTPVNLGEHHVTITVEGSPFLVVLSCQCSKCSKSLGRHRSVQLSLTLLEVLVLTLLCLIVAVTTVAQLQTLLHATFSKL